MAPAIDEDESSDRGVRATMESLSKTVCEISSLPEPRVPLRRACCDLARRVKLLGPLFDEIRDGIRDGSIEGVGIGAVSSLVDALVAAKNQIELVHAQFRRARERADAPDLQLVVDLSLARVGNYSDPNILKRLSEKIQLRRMEDLKQESLALHEMVIASGGDPGDCLEEMMSLLKKLKDCVVVEAPVSENPEGKDRKQ